MKTKFVLSLWATPLTGYHVVHVEQPGDFDGSTILLDENEAEIETVCVCSSAPYIIFV